MKYFRVSSEDIQVPLLGMVKDEEQLKHYYMYELIECLENNVGDEEYINKTLEELKDINNNQHTIDYIKCGMEEFNYKVEEISVKEYYIGLTILHEVVKSDLKGDYIYNLMKDILNRIERGR